ncbi:hypothetical protein PY32053_02916 [Paracoccus yeei]|uniref:Uncharacterized protein n=1 Tax=Paracoccus yeei TaxID=147645 RepID=A0A386UP58_9RHOB|nr:hypothetical protein PY32053_02916 [Paracoccus yeei]
MPARPPGTKNGFRRNRMHPSPFRRRGLKPAGMIVSSLTRPLAR